MRIPDVKHYKIKLFDFSGGLDSSVDAKLLPKEAEESFNFASEDGALKDGEGVKQFIFGENACSFSSVTPQKLYYYKRFDNDENERDDRLLAYADDGYVYERKQDDDSFCKINALHFDSAPEGVGYKYNGDDVFLFSSGGRLYVYDGTSVSDYAAPDVTSMCVYNERLFVTTGGESTTLWFSENFDPTNWYVSLSEAGFIDFQDGKGKLLKVVEFDGYAYVFRSYGITRIYAPADQSEFSAVNIQADKVRIIGGSIVDCGKKIVYLTDNGFYSFGGDVPVKILRKADGFFKGVDNETVTAKYLNGRYYAAINAKIAGKEERVVLSYGTDRGDFYFIKGVSATDTCEAFTDDKARLLLLVSDDKKVYELTSEASFNGKPLKKTWRSPFTDFGIEGKKTLSKISLYTKNDIFVKIESDCGEKSFRVFAKKGLARETVGLSGENFSVSFISELPSAKISGVTLDFTRLK